MSKYCLHTMFEAVYSPNSTCCVTSRLDTTRYIAHAFWHMKSRDLLCRACRTARRDTRVTTSATRATRTTRVQGRRNSLDWGGHVRITFSTTRRYMTRRAYRDVT